MDVCVCCFEGTPLGSPGHGTQKAPFVFGAMPKMDSVSPWIRPGSASSWASCARLSAEGMSLAGLLTGDRGSLVSFGVLLGGVSGLVSGKHSESLREMGVRGVLDSSSRNPRWLHMWFRGVGMMWPKSSLLRSLIFQLPIRVTARPSGPQKRNKSRKLGSSWIFHWVILWLPFLGLAS